MLVLGFGVRYVHVDIELLHEIFSFLGSLLEKVFVADVADQDQVVHVFEVHLDCVDPVVGVVEAEEYVACIEGGVLMRERRRISKTEDRT